jgi:anthranilate phosphoribosyltransferase
MSVAAAIAAPGQPPLEPDAVRPFLGILASGRTLTAEQTETAFRHIMRGAATPSQIGGLLLALRARGETVEEITGAVRALRACMLTVAAPPGTIDTCGTGGDLAGTLNISTAVALVVAACGVPVAKHGNRAVSSRSGAADVLEALGVRIEMPPETAERCLREAGIAFLFAPHYHRAMRSVGACRRELGTRTIFNLLGPLANPAGARRQLLGVFGRDWLEPMALVLRALGAERAWVVHGGDGLDELTTTGPSSVVELHQGRLTAFELTPEQIGLQRAAPAALRGGDAKANAAALVELLHGTRGAYRDIVTLNAAAALVVGGRVGHLAEGAVLAGHAIDSGAAAARLASLVRLSQGQQA